MSFFQNIGQKFQQQNATIITELPSNTANAPDTLEEMEAEAFRLVAKANTGATLSNKMHMGVLFLFKTFAPFLVLLLTVPESIWVFTHIYTKPDEVLNALTGVFAILVDFGYLYITVLLGMNKEAMFQRRRAGLEIEAHERKAVRIQTVLWWIVAPLDTGAQVIFLYSATKDSTFFSYTVVMFLVIVRVFSLFLTMFIVSFASTELMTSVDRVANQKVTEAKAVERVSVALGQARLTRQDVHARLAKEIEKQELEREGNALLTEIYSDARANVRAKLSAPSPIVESRPNKSGGAAKLG